jgi:sodium/hydrogen antiporter
MDSWSLAVVAALVLAYAAVSRRLDRSVVSAAMVFVAGGLLFGPEALGWFDLGIESEGVRILAEATLTVVLFTDASRIDIPALWREVGLPARLLGIGLPLTIVAGTLFAAAAFPQLSWPEALILAIILAPTDAALGQAVVSDKRLPLRVRQSLNVESGLNDGICVPLLLIALAIAEVDQKAFGGGHAVGIVAEEIGYGIVGGVAAGGLAGLALRIVEPRSLVSDAWFQIVPLAAAALAYGIAAPLGGSGFIAAFVGGLVFGGLFRKDRDIGHFSESTGLTLAAVTFVVFGAAALGPALHVVDWRIVLYGILSLTVARMIPVWLSLLGSGARLPTVAYAGWFGPRGLASIVFVVLVLDTSDLDHIDTIVATGVITVALSVYAHGMTAVPFTAAYARWFASQPRALEAESG